jgi:hypothetical protein
LIQKQGHISMRALLVSAFLVSAATASFAQESIKIASLKEPPPQSISAEIRNALIAEGHRIQDKEGRTLADIWLRKGVPGSEQPEGPKGAIQFPFLADGELIGVIQFATEGHDYRDQPIAKGVYTLRYGLQPVNGDHLGVSTYRDYSLLLPASKDQALALVRRKQLEERSAESAGTSHPAIFLLLEAPPESSKSAGSVIHDAEKNTWSVVVPLSLQVKGQADPLAFPVRLVVVGAAAA